MHQSLEVFELDRVATAVFTYYERWGGLFWVFCWGLDELVLSEGGTDDLAISECILLVGPECTGVWFLMFICSDLVGLLRGSVQVFLY